MTTFIFLVICITGFLLSIPVINLLRAISAASYKARHPKTYGYYNTRSGLKY